MSAMADTREAGAGWLLFMCQLSSEAMVGIERLWRRTTLILWLFLQVIQADCVTIEVLGFHLVY
jgi:hypothetical protein